MFKATQPCPMGKESQCDGTQKKNKQGQVINACACCNTTKSRLLGKHK